jgi:HrpA-like RNA helicase
MSWISQQSADQRKGRTGRDRSGTCVRFCTEQFFTEQLEKSRLAEIHRSPLESVLLELLGAAFKPQTLLAGLVDAHRIEETMALLRRLEMIDAADYPTEKGRFVANLPISVRNGAILYDSISGKNKLPIYPTCVFLALIECANGSYLWLPRKTVTVSNNGKERKRAQKINPEEEAEFIEKHFGRFRSDYELVSLAKIWNTMMKATGGLFSPRFKFEDYTRRNHLNTRRFLEVRALLRQLSTFFENTEGFNVESFDELDALRGRMELFTSAYETELWMNGMSGRYRKVTNLGQGNTASLSNRQVICPTSRPNFVLALSGMTIVGNKGAFQLISLWLPCPNGPEIHNRILGSLSRPSTIDSDSD